MKIRIFLLMLLVGLTLLSCEPLKYIVVSKEPTGVFDNCNYCINPLNKRSGKKIDWESGIMAGYDDYNLFDTIVVDRDHFTNF